MSTKRILVLNGPNLNFLGQRDPAHYGTQTLADIEQMLGEQAEALGCAVLCHQSNHEGVLIDHIQAGHHTSTGLIINPGGFAHTSVALRDALADYPHPSIEVHLSNIYAREPFRRTSLVSPAVTGIISGLGADGYRLALQALSQENTSQKSHPHGH